MHYYNFSVLFSRDHDITKVVLSLSRLNFLCVFGMRKCYRSSIIAASWMIVFAFTFDQGLTQTEIALCLSVIDDLHISVRHLRRRLSGLQLYIRQYSDPERVVNFIASQLRHMNSQIMENVIQYYLHVYDSALRIYSQKKSEYRTANYLYCGEIKSIFAAGN